MGEYDNNINNNTNDDGQWKTAEEWRQEEETSQKKMDFSPVEKRKGIMEAADPMEREEAARTGQSRSHSDRVWAGGRSRFPGSSVWIFKSGYRNQRHTAGNDQNDQRFFF